MFALVAANIVWHLALIEFIDRLKRVAGELERLLNLLKEHSEEFRNVLLLETMSRCPTERIRKTVRIDIVFLTHLQLRKELLQLVGD